ncbi:acylphosphatase-1-like [Ischnura elegans]|uniref:acylphosphatase-1-like n=1 Tax=Ischnura elegans TaxID=197161 RepID=UPI001ED891DE|nr:acylphosphatase-1-like [Ischnura elegans]
MNLTLRDYFSINAIAIGYRGKFVTLLCIGLLITGIMGDKIISVDFEVFGKVQGVFFRKNTVLKGKELGLKGWCMNTHKGTVQGYMEGAPKEIEEMKHWLRYTGSKMSIIDRAEFTNEKDIQNYTLSGFSVRH